MYHANRKERKKEDAVEDASKKKIKYKGVQKTKSGKRFNAYIRIDGKQYYPGTFDTPMEAAKAYDLAALQAEYPTSKLNFLDQVPKNYKPKNNGQQSNNTTGFRGVYKMGNRFKAQITVGGKLQHIGMFGTAKEAAEAYDQAALQAKFPRSELHFSDTPKEEKPRIKKRRITSCRNTTNFNGVSKYKKKFQAQITIDGEKKYLGNFTKPRDAAMAYDEAIVANQLPWKKLNFPDGMPIEDQSDDDDGYWM